MCDDGLAIRELSSWQQLVGNSIAKRKALAVIRHPGPTSKMFLAGPSGSAKSSIINHACRVAACVEPDGDEPCGRCSGCDGFVAKHREEGLFAILNAGADREPVHYLPINCRNVTPAQINDELNSIRGLGGRRIIHLEEAAGLKKLQCDESITDIMDSPGFQACCWFATSVSDEGLDVQFRRRWTAKASTERPNAHEAALFIAKNCAEKRIAVDHPSTLQALAAKSWGVIGQALGVLGDVMLDEPRELTRHAVDCYPFPITDPWSQRFFSME